MWLSHYRENFTVSVISSAAPDKLTQILYIIEGIKQATWKYFSLFFRNSSEFLQHLIFGYRSVTDLILRKGDRIYYNRFSSAERQIPRDLCTAPGIISCIISRLTWHSRCGLVARNPDRSWWHRHTSIRFIWSQSMAPCTQKII